MLHALIADGSVRIDGRRAGKGSVVRAGATVTLPEPDDVLLAASPELPLSVLAETAAYVAVDKPGGMPSHPLDPRERGTVANALLARYPETATLGGGLAHRLDTGTSGVLLAARSLEAWSLLRSAFRARTVEKRYLALVAGMAPRAARVEVPLAHDPADRGRMIAARPGLRAWLQGACRARARGGFPASPFSGEGVAGAGPAGVASYRTGDFFSGTNRIVAQVRKRSASIPCLRIR